MSPNNTMISSMTGMLKKYRNLISREKNDGANRGRNELLKNRKTLKNIIINIRRLCKIVSKLRTSDFYSLGITAELRGRETMTKKLMKKAYIFDMLLLSKKPRSFPAPLKGRYGSHLNY